MSIAADHAPPALVAEVAALCARHGAQIVQHDGGILRARFDAAGTGAQLQLGSPAVGGEPRHIYPAEAVLSQPGVNGAAVRSALAAARPSDLTSRSSSMDAMRGRSPYVPAPAVGAGVGSLSQYQAPSSQLRSSSYQSPQPGSYRYQPTAPASQTFQYKYSSTGADDHHSQYPSSSGQHYSSQYSSAGIPSPTAARSPSPTRRPASPTSPTREPLQIRTTTSGDNIIHRTTTTATTNPTGSVRKSALKPSSKDIFSAPSGARPMSASSATSHGSARKGPTHYASGGFRMQSSGSRSHRSASNMVLVDGSGIDDDVPIKGQHYGSVKRPSSKSSRSNEYASSVRKSTTFKR